MSLPAQDKQTLHQVARDSIAFSLANGTSKHYEDLLNNEDYSSALRTESASFVTLKINAQLRGCIGSLIATRPLVLDIAYNARAAAFDDPRFSALSQDEFDELDIHISVLSTPQPMNVSSEQDAIRQLRPNIDGLIIEEGHRRGTFLPSVWESLPRAEDFLRQLKRKANMAENYWSKSLRLSRYTTESF